MNGTIEMNDFLMIGKIYLQVIKRGKKTWARKKHS